MINTRKLTASDAMELGDRLAAFRAYVRGWSARELRRFGEMRLWHAKNHREKWGADYRFTYELTFQEAHESFRLAREKGWRLP